MTVVGFRGNRKDWLLRIFRLAGLRFGGLSFPRIERRQIFGGGEVNNVRLVERTAWRQLWPSGPDGGQPPNRGNEKSVAEPRLKKTAPRQRAVDENVRPEITGVRREIQRRRLVADEAIAQIAKEGSSPRFEFGKEFQFFGEGGLRRKRDDGSFWA